MSGHSNWKRSEEKVKRIADTEVSGINVQPGAGARQEVAK
jgi:hypothetical protein